MSLFSRVIQVLLSDICPVNFGLCNTVSVESPNKIAVETFCPESTDYTAFGNCNVPLNEGYHHTTLE